MAKFQHLVDHFAEYGYTECHYAKYKYILVRSVVILIVTKSLCHCVYVLSGFMLNAVLLRGIMMMRFFCGVM
jgi:hypothetical protein